MLNTDVNDLKKESSEMRNSLDSSAQSAKASADKIRKQQVELGAVA